MIGCTWSLVLKYKDCKEGGIKFLGRVIDKMEYIKGEEEFDDSRGFSDIERELEQQELEGNNNHVPESHHERKSKEKILEHLQQQEDEASFDINLESPIANLQTPNKE